MSEHAKNDPVDEHLRRWEEQLEDVKVPSLFPIPLEPRFTRDAEVVPRVAYQRRNGTGHFVEVAPNEKSPSRPLTEASRALKVEVLRRLPKIYEGLLVRLFNRPR